MHSSAARVLRSSAPKRYEASKQEDDTCTAAEVTSDLLKACFKTYLIQFEGDDNTQRPDHPKRTVR